MALVVLAATLSAAAHRPSPRMIHRSLMLRKLEAIKPDKPIVVGAARTAEYLPLLENKRVALLSNHTGMVGDKHTLDILVENKVNVVTIFSPEHGFRGNADAGEKVSSGVDPVTGIPIASLYDGKSPMPSAETMSGIDVVVVDLQDVGLRFYTYYVTMIHIMDAAARDGKTVVVLDRPNPNIMTVDGPILDMKLKSGVGWIPIPTVYGMTMGELATMVNGEKWLSEGEHQCKLYVVECGNYSRQMRYQLPVAPSPNLPNMLSVYLYPSTCYFEGTPISLGRGTDAPFQLYGHPSMKGSGCSFTFTPESRPGAKNPPCLGQLCYGVDLRGLPADAAIAQGVNLEYVIDAYRRSGLGEKFFTPFFDKLMGRSDIRQMIIDGKSADEIKATWQDDVKRFKAQRELYLLYPDPTEDYRDIPAPPLAP